MVRWRTCLVLAVLLLLPRTGGRSDDGEDDDDHSEESEEDEEKDDEDEDEEPEKPEPPGRRAPALLPSPTPRAQTRTVKKLPLECFVCAYKSATPLKSCLDPVKFRVHSVTCHRADDKCFTSVISKGKSYEAVVRGCRTDCVGSTDTSCCEVNRCNNQAYAMPLQPERLVAPTTAPVIISKATKTPPPSVFYFVTILLVLQTVVKVTFV